MKENPRKKLMMKLIVIKFHQLYSFKLYVNFFVRIYLIWAYWRPFMDATIAPNLVPRVSEKKLLEMVKNYINLGTRREYESKQNTRKNASMLPKFRICLAHSWKKKIYFSKLDWTGVSVSSSLQNLQKERS